MPILLILLIYYHSNVKPLKLNLHSIKEIVINLNSMVYTQPTNLFLNNISR